MKTADLIEFLSLLWNSSSVKLQVPIPDTIFFDDGKISAWYFNSKDGQILKKGSERANLASLENKFTKTAKGRDNTWGLAAIDRRMNPRLLTVDHFLQVVQRLYANAQSKVEYDHGLPQCLQQYVKPMGDLRYVAVCEMKVHEMSCSVFPMVYLGSYQGTYAEDNKSLLTTGKTPIRTPVTDALKDECHRLSYAIVVYLKDVHHKYIDRAVLEFIQDRTGRVIFTNVISVDFVPFADIKNQLNKGPRIPKLALRRELEVIKERQTNIVTTELTATTASDTERSAEDNELDIGHDDSLSPEYSDEDTSPEMRSPSRQRDSSSQKSPHYGMHSRVSYTRGQEDTTANPLRERQSYSRGQETGTASSRRNIHSAPATVRTSDQPAQDATIPSAVGSDAWALGGVAASRDSPISTASGGDLSGRVSSVLLARRPLSAQVTSGRHSATTFARPMSAHVGGGTTTTTGGIPRPMSAQVSGVAKGMTRPMSAHVGHGSGRARPLSARFRDDDGNTPSTPGRLERSSTPSSRIATEVALSLNAHYHQRDGQQERTSPSKATVSPFHRLKAFRAVLDKDDDVMAKLSRLSVAIEETQQLTDEHSAKLEAAERDAYSKAVDIIELEELRSTSAGLQEQSSAMARAIGEILGIMEQERARRQELEGEYERRTQELQAQLEEEKRLREQTTDSVRQLQIEAVLETYKQKVEELGFKLVDGEWQSLKPDLPSPPREPSRSQPSRKAAPKDYRPSYARSTISSAALFSAEPAQVTPRRSGGAREVSATRVGRR